MILALSPWFYLVYFLLAWLLESCSMPGHTLLKSHLASFPVDIVFIYNVPLLISVDTDWTSL